eukprot:5610763-Prymnesium_polylepis.1
MVQAENSLGTAAGFLTVQDESDTPDLATGVWEAVDNGKWRQQPKLRCVAVDPALLLPPVAIQFEGATGGNAKFNGIYKLQAGRIVQDRPEWKAVGPHGQLL